MLAPVDDDARKAGEIFLAHGLADDGEGFFRHLVLWHDVIGFVEIDAVDFRHRDELLDVDGVRAFQGDVVELVVVDQDVLAFFDFIALDAILRLDLLARLGIDNLVADAVSGLAVDDVEADALAGAGGGVERHRAGDQRQFEKALPVRTRCHGSLLTQYRRLNAPKNSRVPARRHWSAGSRARDAFVPALSGRSSRTSLSGCRRVRRRGRRARFPAMSPRSSSWRAGRSRRRAARPDPAVSAARTARSRAWPCRRRSCAGPA